MPSASAVSAEIIMVQKQEIFRNIKKNLAEGQMGVWQFECDGKTYTRRFAAPGRLILLGGGHVAEAVCHFASQLEFSVVVVDDRPAFANSRNFPAADKIVCDEFQKAIEDLRITDRDFVCVITRGHRYDADCLRQIFAGTYPLYLGMIGSKKRVYQLFELLAAEGYDRSLMDNIHSPIGVKIDAVTPREIAVSILAELIACRRKAQMRDKENLVLEQDNVDPRFLDYMADSDEEKAVTVVLSVTGSTPVSSGSVMAINRGGQIFGTIGGGCSEGAVIRDALQIVRNGGSKKIFVDMTNDVAESEGMVCGGTMWVLVDKVENKVQ